MEKVFITMKNAGIFNIVFGVLLTVFSVAATVGGAFMIVHGAKLTKRKSEIMF